MLHDSAPSTSTPKPGMLTAGFITVMTAVVSAMTSGVLWLVSYQGFMTVTGSRNVRDRETLEALAVFDGMVYIVVGLSLVLALGMAAGGIVMMYGKNAGRVLVWTFAGVSIGWRLCCGAYSSIVLTAIYDYGRDRAVPEEFPLTQMTTATVLDLVSAVVSVVAIILIAQSSVNIHFRKIKAEQQGAPSPYQPMPGYYEPFNPGQGGPGPHSAPATPWPYDPTAPPGQSPGQSPTWVDPADDSAWRPPGSHGPSGSPGDGGASGGHPLDPPR